jgi:molecular chaperone HtpG
VTERAFQVDLRGIVDLLSHHLYSSPRVYLRELLQNAADALHARRLRLPPADGAATGRIRLVPADLSGDGRLHCLDGGIGLTPDEIERFLATIGASSKRDELGLARSEFLGQFGIGLLSCFLVADDVDLVTRSAAGGGAMRWVGDSSGTYRVSEADADTAAQLAERLPDGGTWVRLRPRQGTQEWLAGPTVTSLAAEFGAMLPWPVEVDQPGGSRRQITGRPRPWDPRPEDPVGQEAARLGVEELLGVRSLAMLPVAVPQAGLRGTAVILGQPTAASSKPAHRVYAKGMLVGENVPGLVPDWAFFVRCVVDADNLRLTASRESLYEDEVLEHVRSQLGETVRRWMLRTATADPALFARFLDLHALAVKAVAAHDDDLLRAVAPLLRFETTAGQLSLPEVSSRFGVVRFAETVDEYRQIAPVAAAQGLGVVNAGYVYDGELIARLHTLDPQTRAEPLRPGDLTAHVRPLAEADALRMRPFMAAARGVLAELDVDVELRAFEPATLPGLVLDDREARHRRAGRAVAAQGGLWGAVVQDLDDGGDDRLRLLLNHLNPTVRRVAAISDPRLLALAVESLYCHALLLGRHPLRPGDSATLNRSFLGLLQRALDGPEDIA